MHSVLWKTPVPTTAILSPGPKLEFQMLRGAVLTIPYENDDGTPTAAEVVFEGVQAISMTYYNARPDSMLVAIGKLIDMGPTDWLQQVSNALQSHGAGPGGLMHLMINFDAGPCYQVVCRSYAIGTQSGS
jgi:hypothetical protein